MRGLRHRNWAFAPDHTLRRRQAQSGAHGPVEKSVGARLRWPNCLVEAAKQYDIDVDKSRFEKPKDLEARMRPRRATLPD